MLSTLSLIVSLSVCLLFQSFVLQSLTLGTDVHESQSTCTQLKGIQGHLLNYRSLNQIKAYPKFF